MRIFLSTAWLVVSDLAAGIVFVATLQLGFSLTAAVCAGMAFGLAQIGGELAHRRPVEALQWVGLILVLVSGGVTLLTGDARVVMLKPTVIYALIGLVMLRRGWMTRYLPPLARDLVSDVATLFGYLWAALMFATAAINLGAALTLGTLAWAWYMAAWAIFSKLALFLAQYAAMSVIARRRRPA